MSHRISFFTALVVAGTLAAAIAGCEAIASVDRSLIPGAGGSGGTGGTGGGATTTATTSTGTGGMCANPATDCPASATACATATCLNGACSSAFAAMGSACTDSDGKYCDGMGKCVACVSAAECPPSGTACAVAACAMGACSTSAVALGSACTDGGGKVCDGQGKCVACAVGTDCPVEPTLCKVPTCTLSVCGVSNAAMGATCDDVGTVCNGQGECVACNTGTDCPAQTTLCLLDTCALGSCGTTPAAAGATCNDNGGTVCDGFGYCNAASCFDGIQDGDETGVDCGGSCTPCSNTVGCKVAGDCQSGYCDPLALVCTACSLGSQCATGNYCDPSNNGGTCTPETVQGNPCTSGAQCLSGICSSGVDQLCCTDACTGPCSTCATGTCALVTAGQQGGCPANQACDAGGACAELNGQTCTAGTQCDSGICSSGVDQFCCSDACTGPCSTCASGTCAQLPEGSPGACAANHACNAAGVCEEVIGKACTSGAQCDSGICSSGADQFCCTTTCTGSCSSCATGTCTQLAAGNAGACGMNQACNAAGACESVNGQACTAGGTCASGICSSGVDQLCCSDACTGSCSTCASGTCALLAEGAPGTCPANNACNAAGACKFASGQTCTLGTDCASGFCDLRDAGQQVCR